MVHIKKQEERKKKERKKMTVSVCLFVQVTAAHFTGSPSHKVASLTNPSNPIIERKKIAA